MSDTQTRDAPASPAKPLDAPRHHIFHVRRETRRRSLTVQSTERITPQMLRIVFTSPELADFESAGFDDHVKLFLPQPDAAAVEGRPPMRDYTPRLFDRRACALTIDFALHGSGREAGPATVWAIAAKPGDRLDIGGPRGSMLVADDFDWVLMIGDETALPAIGRRVEELRPGVTATTVVIINDARERQTFQARADWRPAWVYRDATVLDDATAIRAALDQLTFPAGDGYVWIAAEGQVARSLRTYMVQQRGHPVAWLKASGYWSRGREGEHETITD